MLKTKTFGLSRSEFAGIKSSQEGADILDEKINEYIEQNHILYGYIISVFNDGNRAFIVYRVQGVM